MRCFLQAIIHLDFIPHSPGSHHISTKTYLAKQGHSIELFFVKDQSWLSILSTLFVSCSPQNGERCRISPPHVNRSSCEGSRSSPTTAFRCLPSHRLETGSAATFCTSKPARTVSIHMQTDTQNKRKSCIFNIFLYGEIQQCLNDAQCMG